VGIAHKSVDRGPRTGKGDIGVDGKNFSERGPGITLLTLSPNPAFCRGSVGQASTASREDGSEPPFYVARQKNRCERGP